MTNQHNVFDSTSKIERLLKRLDRWLWEFESSRHSAWHRRFWHISRVIVAVVRDIVRGHITLHAMSLVYTTLLSIVPFLALSFSVLKGFGVHNQLEPILDRALAAPLGERGPEVVSNILTFVDNIKVGVLGSVGLAFLIYTVISLIQKIERSFNEIWRVSENRSIAQRFSSYLSVIMIGPLLVFSAMGATAAIINSSWVQGIIAFEPFGWLFGLLTSLAPYLVIIGLFTFLYTFIPNTKVKLPHAALGGVVAGIIWQSTVFGFTLFVSMSTRYTAIYSGFAIGIMVLIWLYLTWVILLVGAATSFYSQHAQQITRERVTPPCARIDELTGLAIMHKVARQFDDTGGGVAINQLEATLSVGPEVTSRMIHKMIAHKLVIKAGDEGGYLVPARSLDNIPLHELYQALRAEQSSLPPSLTQNPVLKEFLGQTEAAACEALQERTVADWIRQTT